MNKKISIVLMLTILLSLLTGCFPTGEIKTPSETSTNSIDESMISNELANIKFNIDVADDSPTEAPVIKAKRMTFDDTKMKEMFIGGKEIIKELSGRNVVNYYTADGAWLCVRNDGITFKPEDYSYTSETEKGTISRMQENAATYSLYYSKSFPNINIELEDYPRSEAIERANELVEKVGVKFLGEPTVYTFTAEDIHNFDKQITLSKQDEFYLVIYQTTYNDIPVSLEPNLDNFESRVEIILTKNKLVKLDCHNVFENIEITDTVQVKCDGTDALARLYNYYSLAESTDHLYEYDNLNLTYITDERDSERGEYTYKPLWCATGNMYDSNGQVMANNISKYIDPATGFVF